MQKKLVIGVALVMVLMLAGLAAAVWYLGYQSNPSTIIISSEGVSYSDNLGLVILDSTDNGINVTQNISIENYDGAFPVIYSPDILIEDDIDSCTPEVFGDYNVSAIYNYDAINPGDEILIVPGESELIIEAFGLHRSCPGNISINIELVPVN